MKKLGCLSIALMLLMSSMTTIAQTPLPGAHPHGSETKPSESKNGAEKPTDDAPIITHHAAVIEGATIKYDATASTITLRDPNGESRAHIFYVAYEKMAGGSLNSSTRSSSDTTEPVAPLSENQMRANRPITFIFNGGPGAASIWLHMGVGGPKRVVVPEDGSPPAPPYKLADNPYSWLDVTDMVFIDPVGTGYSRAEKDRDKEFYGARGDIESVSDFIRTYLTDHQRWLSPKFLLGESYGTTRAAGLSEHLHDRYGIDLSGITLMSTVLNFQTLEYAAGNDLPYPLYLPSYAAIAHFHKKLPADLQKLAVADVVAQAKAFALGEYTGALMRGASMPLADRDKIADQLSRFSGLSVDYVKRSNLRVDPPRFRKELMNAEQEFIGRMDGRFTGHNADPIGDTPEFDPTLTGYVGVFSNTFNDYIRQDLNYRDEENYEFLSPLVRGWDFGQSSGFYNVATTLRSAMTKLPKMKLFVACGYYDLATPLAATDYTLNSMPLGDDLRANVTQKYYEGGHMLYLNRPAMIEFKKDLRAFYSDALATTQLAR